MLDRRAFLRSGAAGGAVVATAGLVAACGSGGSGTKSSNATTASNASSKPHKGGNLRVGLTGGSSTDSLDPYLAGLTAIGTARAQSLYQPLVQLAPNGLVEYVLAEEIVPKGSASDWTIRLRKGITFHNGKPFGADDVVSFLHQQVNPKAALSAGPILTPIDPKGIKKVDEHTVEVSMNVPFGSFPEQLAALWWVLYVPPAGWKKGDKPIGTGPFMYESFTPGQESVFKRNPNYWKSGKPYLDTLTISDFNDPTSLANALISNTIDGTGFLTGTQRQALQNQSGIDTVVTKSGAIQPFTMRVDKPPFTDVNVRQAFRYLIDRPQMIATALNNYGWVGNDVTSPLDPDYDHSLKRSQDTDMAKHLLKKAGFGSGLSVTLYTSLAIQSSAPPMAEVFKQQAQAVGVNVNINQVSASDYFGPNVYTKVPFGMIYYDYSPYLSQVNQTFLQTSPYQETHFNDPAYTKLYYEANKTTSASVRRDICYQMQKIDFEQGGYIIPCYMDSIDAYKSNVQGHVQGRVGEAMGGFNFEDYVQGANQEIRRQTRRWHNQN
jgi:peptide/nickel transport system substrate-binding protein